MVNPKTSIPRAIRRPPFVEADCIEPSALNRRTFVIGSLSVLGACSTTETTPPVEANQYSDEAFPIRPVDRRRFADAYLPKRIRMATGEQPGTIIVATNALQLIHVEDAHTVMRYGVAVGASGHAWKGTAVIGRKAKWPAWHPTDDMHAQTPGLPKRIEPGPTNPLGARALYLYIDGRDTLYRIHGTSEPWTIGTQASSGCIRMVNEDIIDLYERTKVGAAVIVR